jgi:catechol 2,3-dioxygenase-like lactoylglutathione lyase family enzyme
MAARKKPAASSTRAQLPKAQIWSVAVLVSDKRRSAEWYTKNLGFDLVEDMDHWITVGREGQGGLIHLCQTSDWSDAETLEPGNQGIQIRLPGDFREACAALEANGVTFSHAPSKEEWGWWASIVDPDGNELSLTPAD